jgi:hypothetical protein
MNQRSIIFMGESVRTVLDRQKIMTRRVIQPQPPSLSRGHEYGHLVGQWWTEYWRRNGMWEDAGKVLKCRYGEVGDLLRVRENLVVEQKATGSDIDCGKFCYQADDREGLWTKENGFRTISARFMPHFACRIVLMITGISIERVQDITLSDSLFEGTPDLRTDQNGWDLRDCFHYYWDKINAPRGYEFTWSNNPLVWVIRFRRLEYE